MTNTIRTSVRKQHGFVERALCPVCDSSNLLCEYDQPFASSPICDFLRRYYHADVDRFGLSRYRLDRCRRCTLLFQRWVGDQGLLTELYGEWIAREGSPESDPVYQRDIANPHWSRDAHEIMTVAQFLGKRPESLRVLDYGMGWGLWARIAKSLGCAVAGVELSPDRRAFARAHEIEVISDEAIGDSEFDFINTDQLMEHVAEPRGTCQRLARGLRLGGVLKVSVPNGRRAGRIVARLKSSPADVTDAELMPIQPLEHINCFNGPSIEFLAREAGLELIHPNWRQRYAFIGKPDSIPRRPKQLAKELLRPFYTFRNSANLYRWLRKNSPVRGHA